MKNKFLFIDQIKKIIEYNVNKTFETDLRLNFNKYYDKH